jgi:hypothetical protein
MSIPVRFRGEFQLLYTTKERIPFYCWKRVVPSIDYDLLDCVVYLYPSADEAELGVEAGGTGFLVNVWPEGEDDFDGGYEHLYAITNEHVVSENAICPSPVIRLNTHTGKHDVYPLDCDGWIPDPGGSDLAVHYFGLVESGSFRYQSISTEKFISESDVRYSRIGPGDDVFMVGRFFLHEGTQRNTPSLRFGNISMMPFEPVKHPSLRDQESFLVEMRSMSGYSGSPVFLYHPYRAPTPKVDRGILRHTGSVLIKQGAPEKTSLWNVKLLGIDWGHIPFQAPVLRKSVNNDGSVGYSETDLVAEDHSSQSGVVPAWILYDLLHSEGFKEMRKAAEKTRREIDKNPSKKKQSRFVLDVKKPEERPFNRGAFEDALRRASRKTEPESKDSDRTE